MKTTLRITILLLSGLILNSCSTEIFDLPGGYRTQNAAAIYDYTTRNVISPVLEMLDIALKYDELAAVKNELEYKFLKDLHFPATEIKKYEINDKTIIQFTTYTTNLRMEISGGNMDEPGSVRHFTGSSFTLTINKDEKENLYLLKVTESLVSNFGKSILANINLSVVAEKKTETDKNPFLYKLTGKGDYHHSGWSDYENRQTYITFDFPKQAISKRFDYYSFSLSGFYFQDGIVELIATGKHLGKDSGAFICVEQNSMIENSDIVKVRFHGITETVDLSAIR